MLTKENPKLVKRINQANTFYETHGSMTIVLGRFIPVIRTFVPFVAGMGEMHYLKFIGYNILGGFLWVSLFLGAGYLFGNLAFIQNNFSIILIAIIVISIIPGILVFFKEKRKLVVSED